MSELAGCYRDYTIWIQPTNCQGMGEQLDVTEIVIGHNFFIFLFSFGGMSAFKSM